jgi:hypothetical protein
MSAVDFPSPNLKSKVIFQNLYEKSNKLGYFQVLRINNLIVSKNLIFTGGGGGRLDEWTYTIPDMKQLMKVSTYRQLYKMLNRVL